MLTVRTELRESKIHGIGVFTLEDIPKGKVVVELVAEQCFTDDDFKYLPDILVAYIKKHCYREGNQYRLPIDNSRFLNSSFGGCIQPNIGPHDGGAEIALVDIKAGEELVSCYGADMFYVQD